MRVKIVSRILKIPSRVINGCVKKILTLKFTHFFAFYIRFLDLFIKRGLGKVALRCMKSFQTQTWAIKSFFLPSLSLKKALCFLVYSLLIFIFCIECFVFLPYENHKRPSHLLIIYLLFGIYLVVNISFHYHKACTVDPGRPEESSLYPWCLPCNNHKPERAHHCSVCERCVLQMDHHCVWINQCVGLNNHRYFLQFVLFVWISQFLILFINYNAFWEHFEALKRMNDIPFCSNAIESAPWQFLLCKNIPNFLNPSMCFIYGLALILFIVLGGFALWNVYLISIGETFIDYLQDSDRCCVRSRWHSARSLGFRLNWRRFLGLVSGRSFICHILLPSSHPQAFDRLSFCDKIIPI